MCFVLQDTPELSSKVAVLFRVPARNAGRFCLALAWRRLRSRFRPPSQVRDDISLSFELAFVKWHTVLSPLPMLVPSVPRLWPGVCSGLLLFLTLGCLLHR